MSLGEFHFVQNNNRFSSFSPSLPGAVLGAFFKLPLIEKVTILPRNGFIFFGLARNKLFVDLFSEVTVGRHGAFEIIVFSLYIGKNVFVRYLRIALIFEPMVGILHGYTMVGKAMRSPFGDRRRIINDVITQ